MKSKIQLDKYQKEAVYTDNKNTLVVAAPGSGKTTVIINRVYHLIKDKRVDHKNIVVITFTKAAAESMKKRYVNLVNNSEIGHRGVPFFGTLHGLFYKILKNYCNSIDIIGENITYKLITNTLRNYLDEVSEEKIRETINYISKFKTSFIPLEEFKCNIDKSIFKHCYEIYEGYKKENNLYDFDDLEIKCRELLMNSQRVLEGYRKLFKYILIDEFQDCDSIQIEILRLLNGENSIFAVGDEDQCIYGFRGARPDYMVSFAESFNKGNKIYLKLNYRSAKNIVEISSNLIRNNKLRNEKEIKSFKDFEKSITVVNSYSENNQAEKIGNVIEKNAKINGCKYIGNAILYRTNMESRSLIDEFIRKKIPFKLLDKKYNFFNHFICKDIIAYLKLSLDNTDRESFFRIINKPFRYISKVNINKVRYASVKEDCFENLKSIEEIPIFQLKVIDGLKRDINYLNKVSLDSAINNIMVCIGYNEYLREYSQKFKIPMEELEEIVEELRQASKGHKTILQFLVHVKEVEDSIKDYKEKDEDCVILSTIHGVKGMEFKNVFIINCNEGSIPHENSMGDEINMEEERRLFYVGITRTIDNLWICTTENIKGKAKSVSRFLTECNLIKNEKLQHNIDEGKIVMHKVFGEGKIIKVCENSITIEFNDGTKRKFDTLITINSGLLS